MMLAAARTGRLLAGALALLFCSACSSPATSAADAAASSPEAGETPDAGTPEAKMPDAGSVTASVAITIADYPGGAGKLLLVPVTVNGSAPVKVLLDTGSSGLRIFASALGAAVIKTINVTSEATTTQFGGEIFSGHKAAGTVRMGGAPALTALVFELVEAVSCVPADPYCDPVTVGQELAASGIQGVLGIGLRADPSGLHSPIARLGAPLSDGFTLRTGGFGAKTGQLQLGARELPGVTPVALKRAGTLPGGRPAWADDELQVCFKVGGSPTQPPCSAAVLDSGSNLDVLYAKGLPASALTADGFLAPGVAFEAAHAGAFALKFTVGASITSSLDGVLVQQDDAFSILGIGVFLRHDVAFDLLNGRIGLRPVTP